MKMIYSCFAGLGKTTLALNNSDFIDLESSDYQWIYPEGITGNKEKRKGLSERTKNPCFPINYVDEMEKQISKGKKVLISSQPEVLAEITNRGLPFVTVTPDKTLKDEYLERFECRGNPEGFINLMSKNFENFTNDLGTNANAVANVIIRKEKTFLSDVL